MDLDGAIIDEHRALVDAMEARDAAAAVRALEDHLNLYRKHLGEMKAVYPHYFQYR